MRGRTIRGARDQQGGTARCCSSPEVQTHFSGCLAAARSPLQRKKGTDSQCYSSSLSGLGDVIQPSNFAPETTRNQQRMTAAKPSNASAAAGERHSDRNILQKSRRFFLADLEIATCNGGLQGGFARLTGTEMRTILVSATSYQWRPVLTPVSGSLNCHEPPARPEASCGSFALVPVSHGGEETPRISSTIMTSRLARQLLSCRNSPCTAFALL